MPNCVNLYPCILYSTFMQIEPCFSIGTNTFLLHSCQTTAEAEGCSSFWGTLYLAWVTWSKSVYFLVESSLTNLNCAMFLHYFCCHKLRHLHCKTWRNRMIFSECLCPFCYCKSFLCILPSQFQGLFKITVGQGIYYCYFPPSISRCFLTCKVNPIVVSAFPFEIFYVIVGLLRSAAGHIHPMKPWSLLFLYLSSQVRLSVYLSVTWCALFPRSATLSFLLCMFLHPCLWRS